MAILGLGRRQRADQPKRTEQPKAKQPDAAATILDLCAEARCDRLARPMINSGVTIEQVKQTLANVRDVRDRLAAGMPDDPKAASAIGDQFVGAFVDGNFGAAVGSLIIEMQARADDSIEIDHHQPQANPSQGGFNPVDTYSR